MNHGKMSFLGMDTNMRSWKVRGQALWCSRGGKLLLCSPQVMPGGSAATWGVSVSLFPPPDTLANQSFFTAGGIVSDNGAPRVWTSKGPRARTCPIATPHHMEKAGNAESPGPLRPRRLPSLLSTWDKKERLQARFPTCFSVSGERPGRAGRPNTAVGLCGHRPFQGCFLPVVLQWPWPPSPILRGQQGGTLLPASDGPHPAWGTWIHIMCPNLQIHLYDLPKWPLQASLLFQDDYKKGQCCPSQTSFPAAWFPASSGGWGIKKKSLLYVDPV